MRSLPRIHRFATRSVAAIAATTVVASWMGCSIILSTDGLSGGARSTDASALDATDGGSPESSLAADVERREGADGASQSDGSGGPLRWVQATDGQSSSGLSTIDTSPFAITPQAGDAIVCMVYGLAGTIVAVNDTANDRFVRAGGPVMILSGAVEVWYALSIGAGSAGSVVSVSFSPSSFDTFISCHEYAGVAGFDTSTSGSQNTGGLIHLPPITTSAKSSLLFAAFYGGQWANNDWMPRSTLAGHLVADELSVPPGSYDPSAVCGGGQCVGIAAAFHGY